MTSIIVYYDNPQIIHTKCKEPNNCNILNFTGDTIHIEYNLDDITMNVTYDDYHPEIDLSVWADKLFHVKKLIVKSPDFTPFSAHNVIGFENYPNLRMLDISHNIGARVENSTGSLNGIEFCQNLESLNISKNNISDLTPISNLNLEHLNIAGNPISSLTSINFKSLKYLEIDGRQLNLINDDCDLSKLEQIRVHHSIWKNSKPPKINEIMQKYPHLNQRKYYPNVIVIRSGQEYEIHI
jgi:Leucine-rich repeat (LRR) protein